ncbi:MAG: hypothetical protein RL323_993, partial [Pseudomonadota bacterium]
MADESSGFFGRWSRRKAQAREGQPLNEPERIKPPWVPDANTRQVAAPQPTQDAVEAPAQSAIVDLPPTPTLEDVQALTQDSNFKPFMTQQVQPEVRNAAMK